MKRLISTTVLLIAVALQVLGQSPRKFSYQAVVRNDDGTIIANQEVVLRVILIADGSKQGEIYSEEHTVTTSPQGVVKLVVGDGSSPTGTLDEVPWSDGNINIQIDIKLDPATEFITMGTTRILAVPYALYAATGTPGPQGPQGDAGIPILWLGNLDAEPVDPELNNAYYNTVDKKSYVFDGTNWTILAQDGTDGIDGEDGIGILWKGSFPTVPVGTPELNWAYYNSTDKKSYIYNGTQWDVLSQDGIDGIPGEDGIGILWKGSLATVPEGTPLLNWAYHNTTDRKSYIFDGTTWTTLAQDGIDGIPGEDGIGVLWKGSLDAEPEGTPLLNWAYYNTTDRKSYIYDGTAWTILAQDGEVGPTGPLVEGAAGEMLVHNGSTWISTGRVILNGETFEVRAEPTHDPEQPIFAVYNSESKLSFAVYEKGTRVYVGDDSKGSKGGFAVGGLTPSKEIQKQTEDPNYMVIYPDSVRFNIVETEDIVKGSKGGFAVGGLTPSKEYPVPTNDYFSLSYDSVRFTIREDQKGSKGGFAVGGLTPSKFGAYDYFSVNSDSTFIKNTLAATGDVIVSGNMSTGGTVGTLPVKDADGNSYQTIRIGNQIWMKENLKVTKYSSNLSAISSADAIIYGVTDNADTLQIFGRLYSQNAIENAAGLCPTGWRVPTYLDWLELLTFVGGADWSGTALVTGRKLMEKGTVGGTDGYWEVDNQANNLSGFSGRPGGYAYDVTSVWYYDQVGYAGNWWGIGQTATPNVYKLDGVTGISVQPAPAGQAHSVRCIKNL